MNVVLNINIVRRTCRLISPIYACYTLADLCFIEISAITNDCWVDQSDTKSPSLCYDMLFAEFVACTVFVTSVKLGVSNFSIMSLAFKPS